ncbi:MAG: glycosyltransferase family 4 protein [Phycisphaerae bacterium]|jgi:glycosyltransferase involved in cell wall biosynthesis
MKLAYIHQYFSTPHGKTGTRSYEFARRWVKAGHEVTVITSVSQLSEDELKQSQKISRTVSQFCIDGIEVIVLNVSYGQKMSKIKRIWSFFYFLFLATIQLLKLKNIDIVFATSTPITVAGPALINKALKNIPFVFEVRDLQPRGYIAWGLIKTRLLIKFSLWVEKFIYKNAAGIVALSTDMKGYIDNVTGDSQKTLTAANCSDTELFRPVAEIEKRKIKLELGLESKFVIVHAGAIGPVNGLDRIIEAACQIKERHPRICFLLIGDGKEKPRLQKIVSEHKLDNVLFVNPLPKKELARILPACDAGLVSIKKMPHMQFNSANKFFDYLACGLPVLLNYGGWQRNVIERYNAGLGCDIFNDEEFLENVFRIERDSELHRVMSRNSRELAETEFNRNILAKKVLDFICLCLEKSRK